MARLFFGFFSTSHPFSFICEGKGLTCKFFCEGGGHECKFLAIGGCECKFKRETIVENTDLYQAHFQSVVKVVTKSFVLEYFGTIVDIKLK